MLSGDIDQVVPRKHMHKLWEIATKRGGNDKGSNEQSDVVPPSKDVFESFMYGSHGKRLFGCLYFSLERGCDVLRYLSGYRSSSRILEHI